MPSAHSTIAWRSDFGPDDEYPMPALSPAAQSLTQFARAEESLLATREDDPSYATPIRFPGGGIDEDSRRARTPWERKGCTSRTSRKTDQCWLRVSNEIGLAPIHWLDDDRRSTDEAFEVVIRQSAQASDEAHLLMRV